MKKRFIAYIIMSITFIIDLVLKLVFKNKSFWVIKNFFKINYIKNYGAAWSFLDGKTFFLIVLSILILGLLIKYYYSFKNNARNIIAFGITIGGLLGNLFDRIIYGYVNDYISLKFGNYYYPIFNFADCMIVIGLFLIIIGIIKKEDNYGKVSSKRK